MAEAAHPETHPAPSSPPAGGGVVLALPRLRPARPEDAADIVALLAAVAVEETLGIDPARLRPEDEARRLAELDLRAACALVVDLGGAVGGLGIAVRGAEPAIAHTAAVSVAVAVAARRRGFGTLLLHGLSAWAETVGVTKLHAGVVSGNVAAYRLFRRAGYTVEGVRRSQVAAGGRHLDEVLFGLCLGGPAAAGAGGPLARVHRHPGPAERRGRPSH